VRVCVCVCVTHGVASRRRTPNLTPPPKTLVSLSFGARVRLVDRCFHLHALRARALLSVRVQEPPEGEGEGLFFKYIYILIYILSWLFIYCKSGLVTCADGAAPRPIGFPALGRRVLRVRAPVLIFFLFFFFFSPPLVEVVGQCALSISKHDPPPPPGSAHCCIGGNVSENNFVF